MGRRIFNGGMSESTSRKYIHLMQDIVVNAIILFVMLQCHLLFPTDLPLALVGCCADAPLPTLLLSAMEVQQIL